MTTETRNETVQRNAKRMVQYLERGTRAATGKEIVKTKDDAPEWVSIVVREAHKDGATGRSGYNLPDDWTYEQIAVMLRLLADGADPEEGPERSGWEPDIYRDELHAWLSRSDRWARASEMATEREAGDLSKAVRWAQVEEARDIWACLVQELGGDGSAVIPETVHGAEA